MKVLVVASAILAVAAAQYLPHAGYGYSGYPHGAGYWNGAAAYRGYAAAPYAAYSAAPYAGYGYAAAPTVASSQYHAQNELGGYNYGYADGLSTKHESTNAYGGTSGSYSYLDANNIVQTVKYVADAAGFRVSGTNLPVAPTANLKAPVHTLVGPAPVEDTADVKAAKAEFSRLYAEAAAAAAAAPDGRKKRSLVAPLPVDDTPEVKAAKAEHAHLYAAAAAAAEAAPDTDGPVYADYGYAGYAARPLSYTGYAARPLSYSGYAAHPLSYNGYAAHPLSYSGYAAHPNAYRLAPAGFSYGFSSAHPAYTTYARYHW